MQIISNETPLFIRWHYMYAHGYNPIRSKVSPLVIDMYDSTFKKCGMRFCHLFAFALYALKNPSRVYSQYVVDRQIPINFPVPIGEPIDILKRLKAEALMITDQQIPNLQGQRIILLGMGGTRRLIEIMRKVPRGANVLIGRYGIGPKVTTHNTRIRGETGLEIEYYNTLEQLKKVCHVESFSLQPRYFHKDNKSHAITRRSMIKDYGNRIHLVHSTKYEDEPYESTRVECDNFTKDMLALAKNGTYLNDLKLAWVANHWEDTVRTLTSNFPLKDCFPERTYSIDPGNENIPDHMHHDYSDTIVTERMLVYADMAYKVDKLFRNALEKGIHDLHITACTVDPGPANVTYGLHHRDPFSYKDVDDMLALHATQNTVQCKHI